MHGIMKPIDFAAVGKRGRERNKRGQTTGRTGLVINSFESVYS